jgi:nicotinamidase-related amidase
MKFVDFINPANTSLLVIDMQNAYCSAKFRPKKLRIFDTSPIDKIIPRLNSFIKEARRKGVPVIWFRAIENPSYGPESLRNKMKFDNTPAISTPGEPSIDYYKIKPEEGDVKFIKDQYDSFSNKDFENLLKKKKIKNLIFTGVYTSRCVDSTVRSAFSRGYNCVIPEDLVATPAQLFNEHVAALSVFRDIFGYVVKSTEIIEAWRGK